jgi:transposase, IS5 family
VRVEGRVIIRSSYAPCVSGEMRPTEGARIWTGHGVLAHNLVKISALAA